MLVKKNYTSHPLFCKQVLEWLGFEVLIFKDLEYGFLWKSFAEGEKFVYNLWSAASKVWGEVMGLRGPNCAQT